MPSYEVVNLVANYRLNEHLRLGINISNLLDDKHWEAFGGDILGRRGLAAMTLKW